MRLQRILAAAGLCSRREAESWLVAGRVRVNGAVGRLGESADPARDVIEVDGRRIGAEPLVYWVANKPRGLLTTRRDPEGRRTVLSLLPSGLPRLFPVGRLDADTEGLVLLTNDGALAHRLLHPSLGSEREYHVTVRGRVTVETLRRLERGIVLDDGPTAPSRVAGVRFAAGAGATCFELVLTEGRKRQIRRTLAALGHPVLALVRTRMGTLRLGRLAGGEARPLTSSELRVLRAHAEALSPAPRLSVDPEGPAPRRGRAGPRL
jgi:23S rRNA pseudouridine2605 synthase